MLSARIKKKKSQGPFEVFSTRETNWAFPWVVFRRCGEMQTPQCYSGIISAQAGGVETTWNQEE